MVFLSGFLNWMTTFALEHRSLLWLSEFDSLDTVNVTLFLEFNAFDDDKDILSINWDLTAASVVALTKFLFEL